MSFWDKLEKPFFVLAPLADVTDAAFRRVIAKYSKPCGPAVMWTEFVSADGLMLADEEGKKKLQADLLYTEAERPIVAQFFTAKPEMMYEAAKLARELGFDGVDINMGCPDRSIEKQGAGAALIKTPELAHELIHEAKRGAGELPVSVKTRIGYNKNELEDWLPALLAAAPVAVTIHARTRKEMSKVPAQWDQIKRAVEIRNELGSNTLIVGNGDALSIEDARGKAHASGCDGVMLGRAIFGNPWLFSEREFAVNHFEASSKPPGDNSDGNKDTMIYHSGSISIEERLRVMVEHTQLFAELLLHPDRTGKNFAIMKKHYKAYVSGWDGAKELRMQLMECHDADEVARVVQEYITSKC